uniref:DUF753 domain-containing protein n=1 Tax=Strongyloides papillosus TaxID=174720 RepID=A0A0N5B7C0_STREA
MCHNKAFFMIFLLKLSSEIFFCDAIKCTSCASKELEVNWSATTLMYPKNTTYFFDSECDRINSPYIEPKCSSYCFSMLVNSNSNFYIVRGCMDDFFNNTVINDVKGKLDEQGEYCLESEEKTPVSDKFYLRYCSKDGCNNNFKVKEFNEVCKSTLPGNNTCYSCNNLYGSGKCKPNSDSTCTGKYCVKVSGHYGEAKFEERRCSNVNPYIKNTCIETDTEFPLSLTSSITANEVIKSTVCYCEGNFCNSSTSRYISMISLLLTIIIII